MIPTIGAMIGGYIIFRCLEIACRAKSSFASDGARTVVVVAAALGILVTGFLTVNLRLSFSGLAPGLSGIGASTGGSVETCRDPHERPGASGLCWCETGYKRDVTTQKCVKE
jgi:hypothetical protein